MTVTSSRTAPALLTITPSLTVPCTFRRMAPSVYCGLTSFTTAGAVTPPPGLQMFSLCAMAVTPTPSTIAAAMIILCIRPSRKWHSGRDWDNTTTSLLDGRNDAAAGHVLNDRVGVVRSKTNIPVWAHKIHRAPLQSDRFGGRSPRKGVERQTARCTYGLQIAGRVAVDVNLPVERRERNEVVTTSVWVV